MREYLKFYIDGQWVDPVELRTLDVENPATEEVAGRIALASAADVDKAVKAARRAFATWSRSSLAERLDLLQAIPEGEPISYYRNGDFLDLCAGPHVMRTGNIGAFKLTTVASAYYKGDEKNPQLQRIYGTAFKNKTELEAYFKMLEEAKRRDHRKIGAEMGLYVIDTEYTGPGLPLTASRKAWRSRCGSCSGAITSALYLVTGSNIGQWWISW